jgi:uncharacterized membrane protein
MTDRREPDTVARFLFWLPLLMIAAAAALSVLALPHLPERMPIHWGIDGQPTRLAPRGAAAFIMIGIMAHSWLMIGGIGWAMMQTREARELSPRLFPAISSATVALLLFMHLSLLANGIGWNVPVPLAANIGVGILFAVMGHKMRSVPPNPIFGVRTPTTLRSPEAWRRANDVGGLAFIYAGVATMLAAPLPAPWPIAVLLGSTVLAGVAGIIAGRRADRGGPEHA